MTGLQTSRPLALAANLRGENLEAVEHLFSRRRVLIRLERQARRSSLARECLLLAVNEILRFCPNVTIAVPPDCEDLAAVAASIASGIHGDLATVVMSTLERVDEGAFDAVLNIGREVRAQPAWTAINASGWSARLAAAATEAQLLPAATAPANIFSWLAAASLGAGQVFLALAGRPPTPRTLELSVWSLETGSMGELDPGPTIGPDLQLTALLVGCGGVANGFAYAVARSDLRGHLEAVDKQSLRRENLGPYICATRQRLGKGKAEVIRDVLAPAIDVLPRPERFHFFQARIGYGQTTIPKLVLSGLDKERVRHDVQRLWAPVTIDMAAEELTSQLIVKHLADDGICLIGAYAVDDQVPGELEQLAADLGFPIERVRLFESEITPDDVAAAPPEKQQALNDAMRRGQRICGRATEFDLHEERQADTFTPAVPFVTALSGILGAAQTTRQLMGQADGSLHFQFSFLSYRGRKTLMRCSPDCECAVRRN